MAVIKKYIRYLITITLIAISISLSVYFFFVGLMVLSLGMSISSVAVLMSIIVAIIWLLTPIVSLAGILTAFVLRKKKRYKHAYLSLLLPCFSVLLGFFIMLVAMILGSI